MFTQIAIAIAIIALCLVCYTIIALKKVQQLQLKFAEDIENTKTIIKNQSKTSQETIAHNQLIAALQAKLHELARRLERIESIERSLSVISQNLHEKTNISKKDIQLPELESVPILVVEHSSDIALNEPPKSEGNYLILKQAINDLLLKQEKVNNKTVLESLGNYIKVESLSLKTAVYYLDGTPSDGLAELIIVMLEDNYYIVPHSNSLANPYLSGWFIIEQGQQLAIQKWPQVVYHQENAKIECINKGVLTV